MTDWIHLSKMVFPCELGIFAWERRRTQSLEVEIGLSLDLEPAQAGDLSQSVDYSAIYEQARFLAHHGRWRLIESLAFALARHLLAPPSPSEPRRAIDAVSVLLRKPEALQGRAIPHVKVERGRAWAPSHLTPPAPRSVAIERLFESDEAGAYHVDFAPGATFVVPKGARGHLVSGELDEDGKRLGPRDEFDPSGHRLTNSSANESRLLLLAFPPLAL